MNKQDYEKKIDFEYLSGGMFRRLFDEKLSTVGTLVRLSGDDVDILRRAVEWIEYTAEKRLKQKIAGAKNIRNAHEKRELKTDEKSVANRKRVKKFRAKSKS